MEAASNNNSSSNDGSGDSSAAAEEKPFSHAAKEETKLSKKERKRLKKEKKKAKKKRKEAKKRKREEKASSDVSNHSNSNAEEDKDASSSSEEENDGAQFSDTEERVDQKNAAKKESNNKENKNNEDEQQREEKSEIKIPRKQKYAEPEGKASGASLIANVQPAKPRTEPAVTAMDFEEEEEEKEGFDEDDDGEAEDYEGEMSLTALKRKILRRNMRTYDQDSDDENFTKQDERKPAAATMSLDQSITPALRSELVCSICHEVFLHPVSLLCGHNFCQECMLWWLQYTTTSQQGKQSCPTCRREIPQKDASSIGVNTTLRACVEALLGNELEARLAAVREVERQATKGENGGAHDRGYEVLTTLDQDRWASLQSFHIRRSLILDAEDQRMQLSLAIMKELGRKGIHYNSRDNTLDVSLCLLTMEEDEVADSGFPRLINEDDDENEHLLVSRHEGRFVHSFIQVVAKGAGRNIPLARRALQSNGVAQMSLDVRDADKQVFHTISFRHEETGAVLELKLSNDQDGFGESTAASALEVDEDDEEGEDHEEDHFQSEDDGSHLDTFERDDFIVDEDEDHNEEDLCWSCRKGGELMICDGGDNYEGCGRSFHIECVSRSTIPPGDWICQDCANDLALDVGVEGHEFPVEDEQEESAGNQERELIDSPTPLNRKRKKRIAKRQESVDIEDSDSDESDKDDDDENNAPAKADQGHNDSDDSEDEKPAAGKKPAKKRICVIDDSDDE